MPDDDDDDLIQLTDEGLASLSGDASYVLDIPSNEWSTQDAGRVVASLLRAGPAPEKRVAEWIDYVSRVAIQFSVVRLVLTERINVRWSDEQDDWVFFTGDGKAVEFNEDFWNDQMGWVS